MKRFVFISIFVFVILSIPQAYAQKGKERMLEFHYTQAAEAYYQGDYDKAISHWKMVLQIDANQKKPKYLIEDARRKKIELRYRKAEEFYQKGDYIQAINQWQEIIELDPNETRAQELILEAKQKVIDLYYKRGEQLFKEEKYEEAIAQWEEILKLDPNQKRATELIERAYVKLLKKRVLDLCQKAETACRDGSYESAYGVYQETFKLDPADITETKIKDSLRKLSRIIEITPEEKEKGKVSELIHKGLINYLLRDGNPRIALNALRYAGQLAPGNEKVKKLSQLVEEEYRSIAQIETFTPGMNLIEQKLLSALNSIYDGKYDLAISECEMVLELEPNNLLAYKRLGSAYYGLGKKSKAKEVWTKGSEIFPDDEELKQSLKE